MVMNIRKAGLQDTKTVMEMLKEAAVWLKSKGSSQWSDVLAGTDKHNLTEAVERGDVYLFNQNDEVVGMAAVWNLPTKWDCELWSNIGLSQDAYYIHRLIVHPNYRGKAYGSQMLKVIKAHFQNTAAELRLDCIASNDKLVRFYQEQGFRNAGTVQLENDGSFELFRCFIGE
ncbi:GNAT family N-acetyltransferase [Enterococcus sp. LJL51]|uniref:GNAT family N-acetyltransferase n=1 Tax=Enterococcus sp. LJL51 TaxID=3416656 RepID=UPI003CEAC59A